MLLSPFFLFFVKICLDYLFDVVLQRIFVRDCGHATGRIDSACAGGTIVLCFVEGWPRVTQLSKPGAADRHTLHCQIEITRYWANNNYVQAASAIPGTTQGGVASQCTALGARGTDGIRITSHRHTMAHGPPQLGAGLRLDALRGGGW